MIQQHQRIYSSPFVRHLLSSAMNLKTMKIKIQCNLQYSKFVEFTLCIFLKLTAMEFYLWGLRWLKIKIPYSFSILSRTLSSYPGHCRGCVCKEHGLSKKSSIYQFIRRDYERRRSSTFCQKSERKKAPENLGWVSCTHFFKQLQF